MTELGQTQIVVYLNGVTDEQVEAVFDGISDVVATNGLGIDEDDEDGAVLCLVGLRPAPFPDFEDSVATKAFLGEHARFSIPVAPKAGADA